MSDVKIRKTEHHQFIILSSLFYQDKNEILSSEEDVPADDSEPSSLDKRIRRLLTVLTEHKGMLLEGFDNAIVKASAFRL